MKKVNLPALSSINIMNRNISVQVFNFLKINGLLQEAILVNASRGPVIDEAALVEHLKANPMFRVGLDVFEVMIFLIF